MILPTHQYKTKLQNFLCNKNFRTSTTDPNKGIPDQNQRINKTKSDPNPERMQMEIHQYEHVRSIHQRTNRGAQT